MIMQFQINISQIILQQINTMDTQGLIVKKGLKGKNNKKKWVKNYDVSGLLDKMQQQGVQQTRRKYAKPLIVEDTSSKVREQLDPNRFKNRIKSQPKPVYDNSYKKANLIQDGMQDVWSTPAESVPRKKSQSVVPTIITPASGHSYNPSKEHIQKVIDEVIDYEKPRPRKMKKIKKLKDIKIIPRSRNKKLRQQYLQARQRRMEKKTANQIYSMKKLKMQLNQKQKKTIQKIQTKQAEKKKRLSEQKSGKVRQGPKIGKKRYTYKQYIPNESQINKKISHVGQSDVLVKQQFDSIFRRGIMEPRNIKVHANKTKNIKVTERFEQE